MKSREAYTAAAGAEDCAKKINDSAGRGRQKEKHTKQGLCCVHSEEEEEEEEEEDDCSCCCLREYILSCKSASFGLCTSARFCFVCAKALQSSIDFFGFWVAAAFHIWFVCSVGDLLWRACELARRPEEELGALERSDGKYVEECFEGVWRFDMASSFHCLLLSGVVHASFLSSSQILLPSSRLHCLVHRCHCNHGPTFARGGDIHQQ